MSKNSRIWVSLTALFLVLIILGHFGLNAFYFRAYRSLKEIPAKEAYRFFWNRAFHHSVLLTALVDDRPALNVLMLAGPGATNYQPGTVLCDESIPLTQQQVQQLRYLASNVSFRRTLVSNYALPYMNTGLDGSVWTIEWKRQGRWHVDGRWSPAGGPIREMGLYMLELSQLPLDPNEIY